MDAASVIDYCLTKKGAYTNTPFGPDVVCVRIGKRIFAEVYILRSPAWVTLRCDPDNALMYRNRYPGRVVRGYHCPSTQQPYSNTVTLDGFIEDDVIIEMIDHSYERCMRSLSREQRELAIGDIGAD